MNIGQYEGIIAKLDEITSRMPAPVVKTPARTSVEEDLRAAAADWMETEIGHVYGQTVLDILDGK